MTDTLAPLLPLVFMAVMGLALLAYVILDGYDLGVGLLLPWATDAEKDLMVASIGPFWDANETWLVLGVGVMLVCFPKAHGVVLGALYIPVTAMLMGLILRGVAFDFRVKAPSPHKPLWNALFVAGSVLASASQGFMLGRYVKGFSEGPWATVFALGIAFTLPAAYAMLGVGWLLMKTDGPLRTKASRWGLRLLWPMGLALLGISAATPLVSHTVMAKWFVLPEFFILLPIPLACGAAFWVLRHVLKTARVVEAGYGWIVFAATVLVFMLAFFGLAYSIYPYIVLDRMTVWEAASSTDALLVIGIGVALTLPVIIVYTGFMYRVFWGKAHALNYGI